MTRKVDWAAAAKLPSDELDRLLAVDADEVDDGVEPTDDELAQVRRGTWRPGKPWPGEPSVPVPTAPVPMTLHVEPDTLAAWRRTGPGWQARAGAVLAEAARKLSKG